jgi:hypothetical protein
MSKWKIYEPVTEFGKKIASLLMFDDGVRLDIHEYLEKVEPELVQLKKDADRYNEIFLTDTIRLSEIDYMDIMARAKKWDRLSHIQKETYAYWMGVQDKLDKLQHILRKTCGSCGHIGVQCYQDRNAVEKITVEQWFKEPEKHVCDDWRFNPNIISDIRKVMRKNNEYDE